MEDPVVQYKSLDEANELIQNRTQGILTGYFESEDSLEYKTFSKVRQFAILKINKIFKK